MNLRLSSMWVAILTTLPGEFLDKILLRFWVRHAIYTLKSCLSKRYHRYQPVPELEPFWQSIRSIKYPESGIVMILAMIVEFKMQAWLEDIFPTRGIRKGLDKQSIEKVTDSDPVREEAIVQKLIAQGKIKRASVNWSNVMLKWIYYQTVFAAVFNWACQTSVQLIDGLSLNDSFEKPRLVSSIKRHITLLS